MTKEEKVKIILNTLYKIYPHPKTALTYTTPLELLVATILSAQATDKVVNTVTPALFSQYNSAKAYAEAAPEEIDSMIAKINFHRNKAKNIHAAAKVLVEQYDGNIPDSMEALLTLPGVARKTANVVLGNAYHKAEGIVVDTHVMRLSQKLGLTDKKDPEKIEQDLMQVVPRENWIDFSHLLILFGREYCPARPHTCADCPLAAVGLCPDDKVN